MTTKIADSKGRIALGSRFAGQTVIVDDSDPQRIVIVPAVVIPADEAWLYKNPEALDSVRRGLEQATERKFSKKVPNIEADTALASRIQD